jgi:hypothetical protein
MILTDVPITHVPGRGEDVQESLVLMVVIALRAMKERAVVAIVNVTIASVKVLIGRVPLHGAPCPVRRLMRRQ